MAKRIKDAMKRYFEERDARSLEKFRLLRVLTLVGFGVLFMALRLLLVYMILVKVEMNSVGWVIFWAQVPMFLMLDLLEKKIA